MRIIGGEFRGRRIHAAGTGRTTRPITDRVKQSLFDRLVVMETLGGHVLDLFAGTGSLGLESLSRGADHCTFVEQDRAARAALQLNLESLDVAGRTTVIAVDALATGWLSRLRPDPVRVAFCDPPYSLSSDPKGAGRIAALAEAVAPVMEPDGVFMLRTERDTAPPSPQRWERVGTHVYGSMALHFFVTREYAPA